MFSQASVIVAGGMHGMVGVCGRGHAWLGPSVAGQGMHSGGGGVVMHSRRDGHCSGRYASYWNTFLL